MPTEIDDASVSIATSLDRMGGTTLVNKDERDGLNMAEGRLAWRRPPAVRGPAPHDR